MAPNARFSRLYEPHAGDWVFMDPDEPRHGPSIYQIIEEPANRQVQLKARRYPRPEETGAWAASATPAFEPGEVVQGPVTKLWRFEAQGRCFVCHTESYNLWIKDGTAPVSVLWDPTLPVFHARRRLYAASETFQNLSEPVWLSSIIAHGTAPAEGSRGKRVSEGCADREQAVKRVKLEELATESIAQKEMDDAQKARDEEKKERERARAVEIAKLKAEVEHAERKEAFFWIALTLEHRPNQWLAAADVEAAYVRYRHSPESRMAEVDWPSLLRLVSNCPTSLLCAAPGATAFHQVGFRDTPIDPVLVRWTLQNYVLDHRFGVTVLSVFDAFRTSPCFAGTPLDPKFANDIISLSRPINGTQYLHSTAGHLLECVVVLGLRPLADPPLGAAPPKISQPLPSSAAAGPPQGDWSQLTPEQFATLPPFQCAAIRKSVARQHAWMAEGPPPPGPSHQEVAFAYALADFFRQNSLEVPPYPTIEGRVLDVFLLYTLVHQAGGFLKARPDDAFWWSVLARMGFMPISGSTHPTSRVQAIRAYAVALYPFEQACTHGAELRLQQERDAKVRRGVGKPEPMGAVARREASVDSGYSGTSPAVLAKHKGVPVTKPTPPALPRASTASAAPTPTAARVAPAPAKSHPPTIPAAVARPSSAASPAPPAVGKAPTSTAAQRNSPPQQVSGSTAPRPRAPLTSVGLPSQSFSNALPSFSTKSVAQHPLPTPTPRREVTAAQKSLAALPLPAFIRHMKMVDPNRSVHYDRTAKVLDGALVCPSMITNVGKERLEKLGLKSGLVRRMLSELGA